MLISAGNIISKSISLYRENMKLFLQYMLLLFIPTAATTILAVIVETLDQYNRQAWFVMSLGYIILVLAVAVISIWISLSFIKVIADRYEAKTPQALKEELTKSKNLILAAILVSILTGLVVLGGLILLIIPGIIFAIWFAFAFYTVALDNKKGVEALRASKQLVQGRWWGVFWRLLAPTIVFGVIIIIAQAIISTPMAYLNENLIAVMFFSLLSSAAALFFTPLTSSAVTILYLELKKNPAPSNPMPPIKPTKK